MRLIQLPLFCILLAATPLATFAAGGGVSVRAIAFVASHAEGRTDPQLAPYEGTLRRNLGFKSFRYVGESSARVPPGGNATLSLPNGDSVTVQSGRGEAVRVQHGDTVVGVSRGRPAVFLGGPAGPDRVSGVIVMAN